MEKSKFTRFIDKYWLGSTCESVEFTVNNDVLSTRAISDDKAVLCDISAPSMGLKEGSYGVYETSKLRHLLGVVDEVLTVKVNEVDDKFIGINFSDLNTNVTFVLADSSVIPVVPDLKQLPKFEISIDLTEIIVNTFIKAQSALADVETFAVVNDNGTVSLVLGHSSLNTNRITIGTPVQVTEDFAPINFSSKYFREILVANKEATNGEVLISTKGLAKITFSVDSINSEYFLVKQDV